MIRPVPRPFAVLATVTLALAPRMAQASVYRLVNVVNPPCTIQIGGEKCYGSLVVRDGKDYSEIKTLKGKDASVKVDAKRFFLEFADAKSLGGSFKGYGFDLSFTGEKGTALSCHVERKIMDREAGLEITNYHWTGKNPKPRFNPMAKFDTKAGSGPYFLSLAF